MKLHVVLLALAAFATTQAYRPLQPQVHKQFPIQGDVGEPLYLTPYIQAGNLTAGRDLARVVDTLEGPIGSEQPESYAGFLTVDEAEGSNMFFWFFPASDVDPATAPVVIWLQGGPGGSSMFGLLELHGPILATDNGNGVEGVPNPYNWAKRANMIYIDNPVGAGFSYSSSSGLPTTQDDVATDLYEALIQWFTLFPEYQGNEFYPFGESYGGKFVPTIARRIHEENPTAALQINLAGIGIGDGFISPPETAIYADYLYQVGLVDEKLRQDLLDREAQMIQYTENGQWYAAWLEWNNEFSVFLNAMGCSYYYEITKCETDPEEDNYDQYIQKDSTRKAIHVGDRPFGQQSGDVYNSMLDDFMRPQSQDIEFLLEYYKVLIYDGNLDIICNHSGILNMFANMETWTGLPSYATTPRTVFTSGGETAGYLKSVDNLRMLVMRNSGHMVPLSQPPWAQDMFEQFLDGSL